MTLINNLVYKDDTIAGSPDALITFTNGSNNEITEKSISFTGGILSGLSDPSASGDLATKGYVDGLKQKLSIMKSVRLSTTAAGTLASDFEDGDSIDGSALVTGDRILIKDQASAIENGVYVVVASGAPTRISDLDTSDSAAGKFTFVEEGTANADTGWLCISDDGSDVVGTDNLDFTQFSAKSTLTEGDGISIDGSSVISVAFLDSEVLNIGTGDDFQISHSGTAATLANSTGNLTIDSTSTVTIQGASSASIQGDSSGNTEILLNGSGSVVMETADGYQAIEIDSNQQVKIGTGNANSTLDIGGSWSVTTDVVTTGQGVGDSNHVIFCDASSGPISMILPAASLARAGRRYDFKAIDLTNWIGISRSFPDTIDGEIQILFTLKNEVISVVCSGDNWYLL